MSSGSHVSYCSSLPDDVLCAIFAASAELDPPYRVQNERNTVVHLGWVTLTHVDRRWRAILLTLSPLWADIICEFPKAACEMIARARDVPLTFNIAYNVLHEDNEEYLVQFALSKISQIRRLQVGSSRNDVDARYQDALTEALTNQPLPLLEELELYFESYVTGSPTGCLDPYLLLCAPALRSFTHSTLFSFACPMLTSLDTTVDGVDIESSPRYLIDMLRAFPLLQTMRLCLRCSDSGETPPDDSPWVACIGQPVVLDNLRSARISSRQQRLDVLGLWACIRAPGNTNVWLRGYDLASAACPTLHALDRQLQDPALDTLLIRCPGDEVKVRSRSSRRTVALGTGRLERNHSQTPAIVSSIIPSLSAIRHLNLLNVTNDGYYDNDEMRCALEPLTSVDTVSVHGEWGVQGILRMMDAPEPIFCKLDTLVLHMRIKDEYDVYDEHDWHTVCWEALTEVLDNRKRAGVPVRELCITGGWISEEVREGYEDVEAPHFARARAAAEVVRDERVVKPYHYECDCGDTDLEYETGDDD